MAEQLAIDIAWVQDGQVRRLGLRVPAGTRLSEAIGIAVREHAVPAWLATDVRAGVGLFGRRRPPDHPLHEGDRIELVGPLLVDPKQARRLRAQRAKAGPPAGAEAGRRRSTA